MITQIVNVSLPEAFEFYAKKYGLLKGKEKILSYAFEFRNVPLNLIRGTIPEKVYLSAKNSALCDLLFMADINESAPIFDAVFLVNLSRITAKQKRKSAR